MEFLKKNVNPTHSKIVGISINKVGSTRSAGYNCSILPINITKGGSITNKNGWNGNEIFEFVVMDMFFSIIWVKYYIIRIIAIVL